MKLRFISRRLARLGLLHLFIVGGQCHTRPLMQVAGVLGCCTPVVTSGPLTAVEWKWEATLMACHGNFISMEKRH